MSSISVVIPCFNREASIGRTLRNVLEQSRRPDEVIVVDDGSTDQSARIVREFGGRVTLIRQENQGPGAARNRGLDASRGDYVWFMDSDDLASGNQLELQWKALIESGADIAYGPWIRSRIEQDRIDFLGPVLQAEALPASRSMLEWQLGSWSTIFQACLFSRKALERAGRYSTDMRVAEDGEYLVRILASGARTTFVRGSLLFYRSDGSDQLTHTTDAADKNASDHTRYFERVCETLRSQIPKLSSAALRDLGLQIYRHDRFCKSHGGSGLSPNSPALEIVERVGLPVLRVLDCYERFERKIRGLAGDLPASKGMQSTLAGAHERALAQCISE
ncbi:glycosyltransferase family 2 protein [Haloferula chungangensis]|uniref:Glycosyltransferase family 2 protein n=1 Tax=Haloferula chungangensis TaxID=1048331 RepID=A0ABW2L6R8_9BACT